VAPDSSFTKRAKSLDMLKLLVKSQGKVDRGTGDAQPSRAPM